MKTMQIPTPDQTLAELAATWPSASRIFHDARLDYCCHGKRSLESACAERGLDPKALLAAIHASTDTPHFDWQSAPLVAVIQRILDRFHAPLRTEIPALCSMARVVEEKHADKAGCPRGLADLLASIEDGVNSHLEKEERILFPLIIAGQGPRA